MSRAHLSRRPRRGHSARERRTSPSVVARGEHVHCRRGRHAQQPRQLCELSRGAHARIARRERNVIEEPRDALSVREIFGIAWHALLTLPLVGLFFVPVDMLTTILWVI